MAEYSPPGSIISWLQEKRHFVLVGSQHEDYKPWKDLFRDVAQQAITFRRAACPGRPHLKGINRSSPRVPFPSALILVPDVQYGKRVAQHLLATSQFGVVQEDLMVNVPRHKDDTLIATLDGLQDLVAAQKINCSKFEIILMCMLNHVLDEKAIQKISEVLPPKNNRSTILYTNRLRSSAREAMRVLFHPKLDLVWIPELIGSARVEQKTIILQDYIRNNCQKNGRNDRVLVLCRTTKEANALCCKVKAMDGTPGASHPPIHGCILARQKKLHEFRTFVNPILFVGVDYIKHLDPESVDCVINFNAESDLWLLQQNSRGRLFCK